LKWGGENKVGISKREEIRTAVLTDLVEGKEASKKERRPRLGMGGILIGPGRSRE